MPIAEDQVRFSSQSLQVRDRFRDLVEEHVHRLAIQRAAAHGRHIVTAEDFMACMDRAFRLAMDQIKAKTA